MNQTFKEIKNLAGKENGSGDVYDLMRETGQMCLDLKRALDKLIEAGKDEELTKKRLELIEVLKRCAEAKASVGGEGDEAHPDALPGVDKKNIKFAELFGTRRVPQRAKKGCEAVFDLAVRDDKDAVEQVEILKYCSEHCSVSPASYLKLHTEISPAQLKKHIYSLLSSGLLQQGFERGSFTLSVRWYFEVSIEEAALIKKAWGMVWNTPASKAMSGEDGKESGKMTNPNYAAIRRLADKQFVAILRSDSFPSRRKAIARIEGCIFASKEIGNPEAAAAYQRILFRLSEIGDYYYKALQKYWR